MVRGLYFLSEVFFSVRYIYIFLELSPSSKLLELTLLLCCGHTSDILLAMVMRFFRELSSRKCVGDKVREFVAKNSTHHISHDFFSAIFSAVASPVRGWLHMRFSPHADDETIF